MDRMAGHGLTGLEMGQIDWKCLETFSKWVRHHQVSWSSSIRFFFKERKYWGWIHIMKGKNELLLRIWQIIWSFTLLKFTVCAFILDFSGISFVCLIAWFAWAGLVRLRGLPDIRHSLISGWEVVPDLPEQDFWSCSKKLGTSSSLINPAQVIRQSGKLSKSVKSQRLE